jgi:hypothetical protein
MSFTESIGIGFVKMVPENSGVELGSGKIPNTAHQVKPILRSSNNESVVKKNTTFSTYISVKGYENHILQTNFRESLKRTEGSIKLQLALKGIEIRNYKKKPTPLDLNQQDQITITGICNVVKWFLVNKLSTKEGINHVLDRFRKVISEVNQSQASSLNDIKIRWIEELRVNQKREEIDKATFGFVLNHEKKRTLSIITLAPEYYSLYLAYLKKEGRVGAWDPREEKAITLYYIKPLLLERYLIAIDQLFNDMDFRSVLKRGLVIK